METDLIVKYFPNLTNIQILQFKKLDIIYREWNAKINVISRKDIDNLYRHHVLHSLSIAKFITFQPRTTLLDMGTGGGFPGIPLAIFFPQCQFKLIDSVGKKIKVVQAVINYLNLKNAVASHLNVVEEKGKYDFVISRAVMNVPDLVHLVRKNISHEQNNALPNGLICLKGGDLSLEKSRFAKCCIEEEISQYFSEDFFKTKKILYIQL